MANLEVRKTEEISQTGEMMQAGQAIQKVATDYVTAMAVQKKRYLPDIVSAVQEEMRYAGEEAYYSWEVWDKKEKKMVTIEGGSINLAMILARLWGNCTTHISVQETPASYFFDARFVDLETGYTCQRLKRWPKTHIVYGNMDAARKEDIRFEIGQSIAIRNVILRGVPSWMTKKAILWAKEYAKRTVDPQELLTALDRSTYAFQANLGIPVEKLEKYLRKDKGEWRGKELVKLRGLYKAIEEHRVTIDEILPGEEPTEEPAPVQKSLTPIKHESESSPPPKRKRKKMPGKITEIGMKENSGEMDADTGENETKTVENLPEETKTVENLPEEVEVTLRLERGTVKIKAKKFPIYSGLDTVIHYDEAEKLWVISEINTGMAIARGKEIHEAAKNTREAVEGYGGIEKVKELIKQKVVRK